MEAQSKPMSRLDSRPGGQEPDYDRSLANERTFIAWIGTALALLAAAVLLFQLGAGKQQRVLLSAAVVALAVCAGAIAVCAYRRWKSGEFAGARQQQAREAVGRKKT
jgi:putative membrane protein